MIERVALNAKVLGGPLGDHDKMVAAASCSEIILWALQGDGDGSEIGGWGRRGTAPCPPPPAVCHPQRFHVLAPKGIFRLGVPVEAVFFVGNQLIAASHTGKIGVWNAVTKHWQVSGGLGDNEGGQVTPPSLLILPRRRSRTWCPSTATTLLAPSSSSAATTAPSTTWVRRALGTPGGQPRGVGVAPGGLR